MVSSHCFSFIRKAEREQEELVWSQSLRGSVGGGPVQENREMQQHPQPQMEAATHCVSHSLCEAVGDIFIIALLLLIHLCIVTLLFENKYVKCF